jgi:hypothetical protein
VRYAVDSLVVLGNEKIKLDSAMLVESTPVEKVLVKTEGQKKTNKMLTDVKPKALMPTQKNKNK